MLDSLSENRIVTIEDGMLAGGLGSLIDCYYSDKDKKNKKLCLRR